jgi:hypothetical protein
MFKLFHELFPEVAAREVRYFRIEGDAPPKGIPTGEYGFIESYCTDPTCDCKRVLLFVTEKHRGVVATISFGFDPAVRFPMNLDPPNPFLDPLNPQSPYAEEILALFKEIALDDEYEERLERHYRMVKALPGQTGSSPIRSWVAEPRPRGESARQKRKQQKAARRANRQP